MKVILILALLSLSVYAETCNSKDDASSYSDCKDLEVETDYYCCFIEQKGTSSDGGTMDKKYCDEFHKFVYENFDETMEKTVKEMKESGFKIEKFNVVCPDKNYSAKADITTPASNNSVKNETNITTTDSSNYLSQTLIILLLLLF